MRANYRLWSWEVREITVVLTKRETKGTFPPSFPLSDLLEGGDDKECAWPGVC